MQSYSDGMEPINTMPEPLSKDDMVLITNGPETWLGPFRVATRGGLVTSVMFGGPEPYVDVEKSDPLGVDVARQVYEFLHGARQRVAAPLDWTVLPPAHADILKTLYEQVGWGEIVTYGELADLAGYHGAARAAGQACKFNPFSVIVPAHRVVAAGGRLGGFLGRPDLKERLLDREGITHLRR
jgi:O-6-methylguanine DNA methyltransferase